MTTTTRRAWLIGGSAFAAIVLAFFTATFVAALARETETVVDSFTAAEVERLDLRNGNGPVEILGGEVDEIEVVAEVDHGLQRTTTSAQVRGGVLELRSSCPLLSKWCRIRYRIVVPDDLAVAVETGNGDLVVRDTEGELRAHSANGSMELTRLGGELDLSTSNGGLEATALRSASVRAESRNGRVDLAFAEPPTDVRAESRNGRVDIAVPDGGTAYRVDLDTRNGDTDTDVRTDPGGDRSIVARSRNGDVTVRYAAG